MYACKYVCMYILLLYMYVCMHVVLLLHVHTICTYIKYIHIYQIYIICMPFFRSRTVLHCAYICIHMYIYIYTYGCMYIYVLYIYIIYIYYTYMPFFRSLPVLNCAYIYIDIICIILCIHIYYIYLYYICLFSFASCVTLLIYI
jgi:hypothetical protein